jgi:hypothetical protein
LVTGSSDGYLIRRAAVDTNIPLFTKATIATIFIEALAKYQKPDIDVISWNEQLKKNKKLKEKISKGG